jgi:membrane-bound lytic murein transglycosylase F
MERLSLSLLILLGTVSAANGQDLPAIQKRGALRVLVVAPPSDQLEFWSFSTGSLPGFEREMMDAFARAHNLRLEAIPHKSWTDLIPALVSGSGDVIAGRFTQTSARAQKIAFTEPVFPTRHVAVTRRPHPPIQSVEELRAEEKVGTILGTSLEETLTAAGVARQHLVAVEPGTLLQALKSGKVGCIVWGVDNAIPAQRADADLQLGAFLGPPGAIAWGVRKDAPELLHRLNTFIEAHRTTEWSRLVLKYFGPAAPELLRKARGE